MIPLRHSLRRQRGRQNSLSGEALWLPRVHGLDRSSAPFAPPMAALVVLVLATNLCASDHADPVDPFRKERLEGGLTDLFVFPIKENDEVAFPFQPTRNRGDSEQTDRGTYFRTDGISLECPDLRPRPELTADEKAQIKALVVILCARRQLTNQESLRLEPYTYFIHMDLRSPVSFYEPGEKGRRGDAEGEPCEDHDRSAGGADHLTVPEARARYGGLIPQPDKIHSNVTFRIRLKDDAKLKEWSFEDKNKELPGNDPIEVVTGVYDDPFIFPAFNGRNVVGIALKIPISRFPEGQEDWIVWATSEKRGRQVDHVGRSLRTQNPRFELLNTLEPRYHVAALTGEHNNPGLFRDLALQFNLQSLFAYRHWDFAPDVLIYTKRFPVGFPNGRLLEDDVAALAAQHGDTLLLELSQHNAPWPRATKNDRPFQAAFPYLADPWKNPQPPDLHSLSPASWLKLAGVAVLLIALLVLENWLVARCYHRWKLRRRYL